jgi:hypothetical protein
MVEKDYNLNEPIRMPLGRFIDKCNQAIGRPAVTTCGGDGRVWGIDLTDNDLIKIHEINKALDVVDSWESSKLRNLTIQQINDRIAIVQTQIDAVTNVATAKTALNSMYADMQKMARIIIWLLKREQGELE